MTVAVIVEPLNGEFAATMPGVPDLRVIRTTREEAVEALQSEIQSRMNRGHLAAIEIRPRGIAAIAGVFRDDTTLRELCDDIYRDRDAELR